MDKKENIKNKYITDSKDQKRLELLCSKMEDDYADYKDYTEYETILQKYPLAYKKVMDKLRQDGVLSIKDLFKMKETKKNMKESWIVAGIIGKLIGITIGLILLSKKKLMIKKL